MQKTKEVVFYTTNNRKSYIKEWIDNLDKKTAARILSRVVRLESGLYGDHKHIEGKIYELRFFFGKGYRVYYIEENNKIILLLNGGDKDSQARDIKKAKELLEDYEKQND